MVSCAVAWALATWLLVRFFSGGFLARNRGRQPEAPREGSEEPDSPKVRIDFCLLGEDLFEFLGVDVEGLGLSEEGVGGRGFRFALGGALGGGL